MDDPMASNGSNVKEQHKMSKEEEEYVDKLLAEKKLVTELKPDLDYIPRLLAQEIERIQNGGRLPGRDEHKKFFDVTKDKPIKVTIRALVPVKDHPKFNFVGKLLGPKGNSLKRLQEETLTKMAILGRGSMRDKQKEEECRQSSESRYKHLNEDLHVEISAFAAPAEAHARIALALTEIRRFLVPDYNDEIRQEQLREMQMMNAAGPSQPGSLPATSAADLLVAAAASNNADHHHHHAHLQSSNSVNNNVITSVAGTASSSNNCMGTNVCTSVSSAPATRHPNANLQSLGALGIPSGAMPGGLTAPGLGARVPAPCPPMLPLLHPALRGLCKPAQNIGIGFGPAAVQRHSGLIAGAAAGRFRPNLSPSSMMSSTARRNMLSLLNRMREQGKDDFLDPTNDLAFLDLYGRYSLSYEGSDGVGSPDDREDGPEENFAGTVPGEFALMDGTCLKMTSFERTRYRHDPYPRPNAELTYVHEGPSASHTGT